MVLFFESDEEQRNVAMTIGGPEADKIEQIDDEANPMVTVAQPHYGGFDLTQVAFRGIEGIRRTYSGGFNQQQPVCPSDARNVEIDVKSQTDIRMVVKIVCPTGEVGELSFSHNGDHQSFSPRGQGCGHGKWIIRVYKFLETGREEVAEQEVGCGGTGTIYCIVTEDLQPKIIGRDYLATKYVCPFNH